MGYVYVVLRVVHASSSANFSGKVYESSLLSFFKKKSAK